MLKRLELVVAFFFSFVRLPAPSFTMMRVFASFALLLSATALPVPPGVTSGLYSDLVAKSDFTLNLQPPTESAADVSDALDAVLKLEEQKNHAAFAQFAAQKQQLIVAEKKARSPPSLFLQYVCCLLSLRVTVFVVVAILPTVRFSSARRSRSSSRAPSRRPRTAP